MKYLLLTFFYFEAAFCGLSERIDGLIQRVDPDAHIGIEIVLLDEEKPLYQKNASHLFTPASTAKILTGAAAFFFLGSDFSFKTELLIDDKNLYIKGSGDPEFSSKDLNALILALKEKNVTVIKGDLILDNTCFDKLEKGPGWMWDDSGEYWNVPIEGLTVDHGCVELVLEGGNSLGDLPSCALSPITNHVSIKNLAITAEQEEDLDVKRRWITHENVIEIRGKIPPRKAKTYAISVESPSLYLGDLCLDLLKKHHIKLEGSVKRGKVPKSAEVASAHFSSSLRTIVQKMMKESDNLYADSLFKKIGEKRFGPPGTWKKGSLALKEYLESFCKLKEGKYTVLDGSGLSRYNLIAPHQFTTVLKALYKDPKQFSEFVSTLPISATDGSLKNRMQEGNLKGRVFAKTGGMSGVSSLVGFVKLKTNKMAAFSILINGFVNSPSFYKTQLEDQICKIILEEL